MGKQQVDSSITRLNISKITIDEGIQPRQQLNQKVVAEYAEVMKQGAQFPPVIVFHDGSNFWLADGFHRMAAKQTNGDLEILAEVELGSQREAKLYAVGANIAHGLRRSNLDKRRVVNMLLRDSEWCKWSNREIARRCGVSYEMVRNIRGESSDNSCQRQNNTEAIHVPVNRLVRRNGKVQSMNISNIGTRFLENKNIPSYSKAAQKKDVGSHIHNQQSEHQPKPTVKSTDQQVPIYKPFRIIDTETVPPEESNTQLEIYSRILMEGPIKAWSIILTQMQTHPDFAEMVWKEAQDLWASSN